MKTLQVTVDDKTAKDIATLAERGKRSVSGQISYMISEFLSVLCGTGATPTQVEKIMNDLTAKLRTWRK